MEILQIFWSTFILRNEPEWIRVPWSLTLSSDLLLPSLLGGQRKHEEKLWVDQAALPGQATPGGEGRQAWANGMSTGPGATWLGLQFWCHLYVLLLESHSLSQELCFTSENWKEWVMWSVKALLTPELVLSSLEASIFCYCFFLQVTWMPFFLLPWPFFAFFLSLPDIPQLPCFVPCHPKT